MRSLTDGNFYVGLTQDLRNRINQHQAGEVQSTRTRRPFELIYYEACQNVQDAARREKYLKTAWGKRYLKQRMALYLTG
ncbi:MAG: GIY-YIG nuclease family protein [Negativicutes bacterium]|nr:GIY-YIG nuclease family protein [Negativicutes bacterium]